MKTIALLTALSLPFLPVGGTVLTFPLQGSSEDSGKTAGLKASITFETWDCPDHPAKDPGKIQLLRCATCGSALVRAETPHGRKSEKSERIVRVEAKGRELTIVSGPWTGIGLLRLSTIRAALADTGLSVPDDGWKVAGHVLFEVAASAKAKPEAKPEDLRRALAPFGAVEMDSLPGRVLVRLNGEKRDSEHVRLTQAIHRSGYEVKDTLWIVNQCSGELVLAR
jgi:hypothetical protein